jgi:ribonuclease J
MYLRTRLSPTFLFRKARERKRFESKQQYANEQLFPEAGPNRPEGSFGTPAGANQNKLSQKNPSRESAPLAGHIGAFEGIVAHAQAPRALRKKPESPQAKPGQKPQGPGPRFGAKERGPHQGRQSAGKKGGRRDNRRFAPATGRTFETKRNGQDVPPLGEKRLRIVPLGGQEEVGRNMTAFEYGGDIVIIDMGLQFPEEDMPGIDYIVPNVYLGEKRRIRRVFTRHSTTSAPRRYSEALGYPVIARDFTLALIKHKVEDQEKGAASRLKMIRVKTLDDKIKLGAFESSFFEVEHSIMDAIGIILKTPVGTVIHMGDWTISNEPLEEKEISYRHLADLPRPTILMLESLGALKKGLPPSEREVHQNLQNLIKTVPGRLIIGTFASQVRRISYLIEYAERVGKKVALEGYSMKMNIEVAK